MRVEDKRKGFVLVMVSLMLVILIGFVALGVDVGVVYSGRTSAQAAADAGALAGAFTFVVHGDATEDEVRAKAMAAANVNKIMGEPVTVTAADIDVDMTMRRVTVRVNREVKTFFTKALGISSMDVGVVAVAEAGVTPTAAYCLKPFVIPNTALSPSGPCDACVSGQVLVDVDGHKTAYADTILGNQFTLKPQNPANAWVSSNFMAVEISGPGSDNYRDDIAGCTGVIVKCGDLLNVQTGNMVGPTRQGILGGGQAGDGLLGNPADHYWDIADYGPNHTDTSRALVVAPLWNSCLNDQFKQGSTGECPATSLPSGSTVQYNVNGYALIFVEGVENGADGGVVGRLIDVFGCETGFTSVTQPGPYALPVRLIRP
jgi:Flp pilus assembly protein TadG